MMLQRVRAALATLAARRDTPPPLIPPTAQTPRLGQRTGLELRQAALLATAEAVIDNAERHNGGVARVTFVDLDRLAAAAEAVAAATTPTDQQQESQ